MVARLDLRDRLGISPFLAKRLPGCKKRTMADVLAAELEGAIADMGLLLVELEKFHVAPGSSGDALRAEALRLGDRARRLHRSGTLDDPATAVLVRDAGDVVRRLRRSLRDIRDAADYRAAVVAHRTGDHTALAALLPALFVGLDPVGQPPALFHPVAWLRRNRPRPPADLAADVARMRHAGLVAAGDATGWGSDPELPAVQLLTAPPAGDPIALRFDPGTLPPAIFRLRDTDEYLVHVPVLRAPFAAVVPATLDPDELGEISLDHPHYRGLLLEALESISVPIHGA